MPYEKNAVGEAPPTATVAFANQPENETYHKGARISRSKKRIWRYFGRDLAALRCLLETFQ